ncbi:MAG TPA: M15 family metallopeptidase [Solirubrobacteraceae bacterium]|nr:M15 family metallopeptidase [Solirubrobacteraceae bacterium]
MTSRRWALVTPVALAALALAVTGALAEAPADRHAGGAGSAAPAQALPTTSALARAGLVDVRTYAPSILVDARYATANNFTGRRLPGYCRPWAFLKQAAARRLARVQRRLRRDGLGLKVLDAYRPARASRAMVRWAQRTGNGWVLTRGYVARRSNHARGTTIDVTLVRLSSGRALDMGTAFDAFTPRSATLNARGAVRLRRLRLVRAMEGAGFRNYAREWWHYDFEARGPSRLDVPLGCRR